MTDSPDPAPRLAPISSADRIGVLDVLRGFALIGICVVNVEFFNRAVAESGSGLQPGLAGLDWLLAFIVNYFVTAKFWTIFSLLFGMGFAVMLGRAQAAGRAFLPPYLRRIAALAVFGLLHTVFLWGGDILFDYALGALLLLLTLYASARWFAATFLAFLALAMLPGLTGIAGNAAFSVAVAALAALWLRGSDKPRRMPLLATLLLLAGVVLVLAAIAFFVLGKSGTRGLAIIGILLLVLGALARRFTPSVEGRQWRIGVAVYALTCLLIGLDGAMTYYDRTASSAPVGTVTELEPQDAEPDERAEAEARRTARVLEERAVLASGSYPEAVAFRIRYLADDISNETVFSIMVMGMFLLGSWFVRAGVIQHAHAHLPLFRQLAWIGIPAGLLTGFAGIPIAMSQPLGVDDGSYQFASSLLLLGSLPASLGYVSVVVLLLQRSGMRSRLWILAPYGRMALTNYLVQSLVLSLLFYNHGLGLWGIGRTWQIGIALALCAAQVAFSHWWLARFQYGPFEWLWRALTYLKRPALRGGARA